jgi:hypothetical protein
MMMASRYDTDWMRAERQRRDDARAAAASLDDGIDIRLISQQQLKALAQGCPQRLRSDDPWRYDAAVQLELKRRRATGLYR